MMKIHHLLYLFAALTIQSSFAFGTVNAVGYVNITIVPGFSLISNPLFAEGDSSIQAVFRRGIQGEIPEGLRVFILAPTGYRSATYDSLSGKFLPEDVASEQIQPGLGFYVFNPSSQNLTITFVGEVLQGVLVNPLPQGYSLVSNMIPKEATLDEMNFPGWSGDIVYLFDPATKKFSISVYDDLDQAWVPQPRKIRVGEAFIVLKREPTEWVQTFFLNQAPDDASIAVD